MPAYLQLGHHSENLLLEEGLSGFSGVVLSPVNYDPEATRSRILPRLEQRSLDLVFDPQLYNPRSSKAPLKAWSYFPSDFESTDSGNLEWWQGVNDGLARAALEIGARKVCSPSTLPRNFDDSYYGFTNQVYRQLADRLKDTTAVPYQTVLVDYADIGREHRAEQVASIIIQAAPIGVYLVILGEVSPRQEFVDAESLRGLMQVIHYLEVSDVPVLVSHCSADQLLWKAAGATACSTGKFFNLRRFSRSRFDDAADSGGGQLPYWFEEGLLAFLRQGDVIRLDRNRPSMLGIGNSTNEYGDRILTSLRENPRAAWLALSWRHFLSWFASAEKLLDGNGLDQAQALTQKAERAWQELENAGQHLMEEKYNDGRWIRPWRIALQEFSRTLD